MKVRHSALIVVSKYHFLQRNQTSLDKWLIPGLGKEMYKSLETLSYQKTRKLLEVCQRRFRRRHLSSFPLAKAEIILASVRITSARDWSSLCFTPWVNNLQNHSYLWNMLLNIPADQEEWKLSPFYPPVINRCRQWSPVTANLTKR